MNRIKSLSSTMLPDEIILDTTKIILHISLETVCIIEKN